MSNSQSIKVRNLLAKIYSRLRQFKSQLTAWFYRLTSGIWFQQVGSGCCFYGLPRFGYAFRDIRLGNDCSLGVGVFLNAGENSEIVIGDSVGINDYCYISAVYGVTIGDHARIGEFVSIRDNDHAFSNPDIPIHTQGFTGKAIQIGSDVWIGRGVFIGKGVEIGDGAVIGANSVVTRSIPPYGVAVGSPAKVIKYRQRDTPAEVAVCSI